MTEWHIDADEPVVMNYNTEFKTDDPFNIGDPFGASDHDPLVIGLSLTVPAAVPAISPAGLAMLTLLLAACGTWALRRRQRR